MTTASLARAAVLLMLWLPVASGCSDAEPTTDDADTWARSVECFDRAVTLVKQPGWQIEAPSVSNWAAHYNRDHKACYLNFTVISPPALQETLYNVLENRELASCSDESAGDPIVRALMCNIASDESARGDCGKCKTFIAERMSQ